MKLVMFKRAGHARLGAVVDNKVIDLNAALPGKDELPSDMTAFLRMGEDGLEKARGAVADHEGNAKAIIGEFGKMELMAPVPNPPKLMMGGRNYLRHIDELRISEDAGIRVPPTPRIFAKYNICITGPFCTVVYPEMVEKLDFEGEFSVVIGKDGRFIREEEAMDYVCGYTIVNDVSARDIQLTGELIVAKNFETFAPMGPWLITKDEVPDPHNLRVRTYINGEQMSESCTADMLFNIPQYISFLSRVFPLQVGDVLTTGSPPGPGMFRDPPRFTEVGDVMRIDVEHVGVLENPVVAQKTA